MALPRLHLPHTALLVVDIQEKLLPHMHNALQVLDQASRLLDGAAALGLPVLVTEQYRKGLGVTVSDLAGKISGALCNVEKLRFSACVEPVRRELENRSIRSVLVCGIEAHVCVLQTCLDLAQAGYVTAVALDAIGSRRLSDQEAAVSRMIQAGVIPTSVESALLELVGEAGTNAFRSLLPIIK